MHMLKKGRLTIRNLQTKEMNVLFHNKAQLLSSIYDDKKFESKHCNLHWLHLIQQNHII